MAINVTSLETIIAEKLKPVVKKVDEQAFYAEDYIFTLGKEGFFSSANKDEATYLVDEANVVLETAKVCMTTAFCVWCHLAALTYIRNSDNAFLKNEILPKLENGELLGATGLSNPMKYFSGLEELHLSAERVEGGYKVNGVLPAVSNLGSNHYFGAIAKLGDREVMLLVSPKQEGISLKEKVSFVGVNGSATYAVRFTDVVIEDNFVITHDAKSFCDKIRPTFIYYQVPLGAGVIASSADCIDKVKGKQNGGNAYHEVQSSKLRADYERILQQLEQLPQQLSLKSVVETRLSAVYDTLEAVQASMLHNGAGGYVEGSVPFRKLREAYFFANLTPTVRHLEKLKASLS